MLSIPHMIIIFIVALIFFGPEKLPELARNIGKVMAEFKRATGDFKSTFEDHLRQLERDADQRRINGAPAATEVLAAASSDPVSVPPEPGTVPTTPPHLASGSSTDDAPWEEAENTAADAMNYSPNAPEPAGDIHEPPHSAEASLHPELPEKSHQKTEEGSETAIHDDLPA